MQRHKNRFINSGKNTRRFLFVFIKGFINSKNTLKLRLYFTELPSELTVKLEAITLEQNTKCPNLDWQNHLKDAF